MGVCVREREGERFREGRREGVAKLSSICAGKSETCSQLRREKVI
jgi:hypothetical protein